MKTSSFQCLILSLLSLLSASLCAQEPVNEFEHILLKQGTPEDRLGAVCQDGKGFMWIGTSERLTRYDGHDFTDFRHDPHDTMSISSDNVSVLYADRDGVLWVGTDGGGLDKYETESGSFVAFRHDSLDSRSLSNDFVRCMIEDRTGMFWVGTWDGLNVFDRQRGVFRVYRHEPDNPMSLSSSDVKAVYEDRSGTIWIGTEGGLNRYDRQSGTFRVFRNDPGHPEKQTNDVYSILEDRFGNLWIATQEGGIWKFDRQREQFTSFTNRPLNPETLTNDLVNAAFVDHSGTFWVGTFNGLSKFNRQKRVFTRYKSDLRNSACLIGRISSIYQDKSGSIWITPGVGLFRLDRQRTRFQLIRNVPDDPNSLSLDHTYSILEDESGMLWIGTSGGGLNRFNRDKGEFTIFRHQSNNPKSLSSDKIRPIVEDSSGILWIGTENGLNRFDRVRQQFTLFKRESASLQKGYEDFVYSMTIGRSGTLWVGTAQGLYAFDRDRKIFHEFDHDSPDPIGLTKRAIISLLEDREEILWAGTADGGLYRFDKRTNKVTLFKHEPHNPNSLSSNHVASICEAKSGTLWVGTDHGLNQFSVEKGEWRVFNVQDGLPGEMVYSILEDNRGDLWIGTNMGLSRFNVGTGKFRNYDISDGLQGSDFNVGSCFKSSRGELLFGGVNGVNAFFPDSIHDNPLPPPIVITSFKKFYKEFKLPKDITVTDEILLSHDDDVFSFEFAALNFIHPEKNQYDYKLEGFDKDWVYSGSANIATYTHLDPGGYVFKVKGSNNDGVWNEAGAMVRIVITPPFWTTWWFRSFAFIALLISVGGSIRYVEMRKLKRKIERLEHEGAMGRERMRISQDMHDEVGAGLSEIGILSELAKKDIRNPDELDIYMQRISATSREIIASISEIIWAINPKNDLLDDVVAYLRHYTTRYLGSTEIRMQFDIPETIPDLHLSAEARRNIFLVMKEALHNIVKHSQATSVFIKVSFTKHQVDMLITDNGKGFSARDTSRFGNGLHSMEKRMKSIGGEFAVHSSPLEGTSVTITVEL